ncbi:T9SS type A sorting domain-containing protein [Candidatus Eisenbacteria bacterium]|uniref:T9SS type A sorting domain-containing protein n=1 Tax=Eiseniibacteriota bacterium TaxID=2212470 RepID=A0ABV6YLL1_UNCEI
MKGAVRCISHCVVLVTVSHLAAGSVSAQDRYAELERVLADLSDEHVQSGILYDRILPLSRIEEFDGTKGAPAATLREWRQMYYEIRRASISLPPWPSLETVSQRAETGIQRGVVPLAIMDFRYDKLRPDALLQGAIIVRDGRLTLGTGDPFISQRVFSVAPLREYTHRGNEVVFDLAIDGYFTNRAVAPRMVQIDFDDGRGFRTVMTGHERVVRYVTPGSKTIRLRATHNDISGESGDTTLEASFLFDVRALRTPAPDDTLHIQATVPYLGSFGTGDAYVYLADEHATLTEPVVLIEGFDLDNSMNWDELYELLNREGLLETLRSRGFDAVILNFTDAVDHIQRNAFVTVELLQQIRMSIAPTTTIAVAGASMGGLVGRYAIAYMETNALEHAVRTFISFDSPQSGADIPLGMQYWLWFFADQSPDAAALLAALDSPAARQLLLYHYTDPPGNTGESDPLRGELYADLAAVGDYPQLPRLVAIANGSGAQAGQGFGAGDQIIEWEYSSFLVDITGNVWAVPDASSQLIFDGLVDIILLPQEEMQVVVSDTGPLDNAPGGWRGSMAEMDATEAPYGDIVALHPNHCFIPSISALDVETSDLFYDIVGDLDLLANTPFDAVYFPVDNQEHVEINPENAGWLIAEIELGASGLADKARALSPAASIDAAAPNPFTDQAQLRFTIPMAGLGRVAVYDATGREVACLAKRHFDAGDWEIGWNGDGANGVRLAPGVYFVQVQGKGCVASRKLLLR